MSDDAIRNIASMVGTAAATINFIAAGAIWYLYRGWRPMNPWTGGIRFTLWALMLGIIPSKVGDGFARMLFGLPGGGEKLVEGVAGTIGVWLILGFMLFPIGFWRTRRALANPK